MNTEQLFSAAIEARFSSFLTRQTKCLGTVSSVALLRSLQSVHSCILRYCMLEFCFKYS